MRYKKYFLIFLLLPFIIMDACKHEPIEPTPDLTISLRWNQAYESETKEQVETGLRWCLSFLGASLPAHMDAALFEWQTQTRLNLHLDKAGFSPTATQALVKLLKVMRENDEYRKTGGIDMGRFVMLTLNSSNHYYAITGAATDFNTYRSRYLYDHKKSALVESTVSQKHRLIEFPSNNNSSYIVHDLEGSVVSGNYSVIEHEVMDVMPNGQLRFSIYNGSGALVLASDTHATIAGKPAKCLWCHEINIQKPFGATTSVPGYYTVQEFNDHVKQKMTDLENYRSLLISSADFTQKQDHAQTELLYITFTEPTAQRLALEWQLPFDKVLQKLSGLPTHTHAEFPFLGALYYRADVDPLSPYAYIRVPESAREISSYEPNLIR